MKKRIVQAGQNLKLIVKTGNSISAKDAGLLVNDNSSRYDMIEELLTKENMYNTCLPKN